MTATLAAAQAQLSTGRQRPRSPGLRAEDRPVGQGGRGGQAAVGRPCSRRAVTSRDRGRRPHRVAGDSLAPWADEDYATARAEVFLAALELHKALISIAQADVFAANLGALMDLLGTERSDALSATRPLNPAQAAATGESEECWVGRRPLMGCGARTGQHERLKRSGRRDEKLRRRGKNRGDEDGGQRGFPRPSRTRRRRPSRPRGSRSSSSCPWSTCRRSNREALAGLGPTPLGWLLADHAERLPGWQAGGVLGRLDHAVFAGDTAGSGGTALGDGRGDHRSGDRAGAATRYGGDTTETATIDGRRRQGGRRG